MKKIRLILTFAVFVSLKLDAQTYHIDTSSITFENKLRPCFSVNYDADPKTVKKAWDDFLKKNYKIKANGIGLLTDKELVTAEDVTVNSISDKRMNMYANVTKLADGSVMRYFASFGYDFFIGPDNYPQEFGGMKKLFNDFSVDFLNKYYGDETSDILKDIKRYEKDIKKDNKTIKKNVKKSNKASAAEASGLEARNNTHNNEISNTEDKIKALQDKLEVIKVKQKGITRN